ncbi:hypothetical protein ACH5RR_028976 [Cinchona calisaya]|uniref:Uncharacterized protein n=1 Tax=Cinchona calisaya TaxID=153742 RepID=A0ABD2YU88_9GENT
MEIKILSFFILPLCRRKRNNLLSLMKVNGGACESLDNVVQEVSSYYSDLLITSSPTNFDEILTSISSNMTVEMHAKLVKPISEAENKKAIFSMSPSKTPEFDA